jgi:GNAT superfamily N-acetyltransferase
MMASLGYPSDPSALRERIPRILNTPGAEILVATADGADKPLGLLALQFLPQLGIEGEVAHICFLVVDGSYHRGGVGRALESHAEKLARERGCDRMVHHTPILGGFGGGG